jgi:tRNA A37 threonylcarbamoyladenosine dehydratase
MNDFESRFGGIQRLYSADGLQRLRRSSVRVVGLGGVGSWAAEALARSAVGQITLVDFDDICVTNVNRQLHALDGTIGRPKSEVMAQRIQSINPDCQALPVRQSFNASTAPQILSHFDWVLDAIDQVANKCLLIALCRQNHIRIFSSGGAQGRRDPAAVQVADLAHTTHDALLQHVRKTLRDEHGFPRDPKTPFNVPCVFSREPRVCPVSAADPGDGGPARRDNAYGAATFVTGTFGFLAVSRIVSNIAAGSAYGSHPA